MYAKLSELGPPLAEGTEEWQPEWRLRDRAELPANYWDFQTKVIDDEQKWEMRMRMESEGVLRRVIPAEGEPDYSV